MRFEPNVWGPHYWFFLHSIAHSYSSHPNEVTKRKYSLTGLSFYKLLYIVQNVLMIMDNNSKLCTASGPDAIVHYCKK